MNGRKEKLYFLALVRYLQGVRDAVSSGRVVRGTSNRVGGYVKDVYDVICRALKKKRMPITIVLHSLPLTAVFMSKKLELA